MYGILVLLGCVVIIAFLANDYRKREGQARAEGVAPLSQYQLRKMYDRLTPAGYSSIAGLDLIAIFIMVIAVFFIRRNFPDVPPLALWLGEMTLGVLFFVGRWRRRGGSGAPGR